MFLMVRRITNHDLAKLLVARQQLIKRFQFTQSGWFERSAHVFVDKWFEPIPERACLRRNAIKLTRDSALSESTQYVIGHQSGLL